MAEGSFDKLVWQQVATWCVITAFTHSSAPSSVQQTALTCTELQHNALDAAQCLDA